MLTKRILTLFFLLTSSCASAPQPATQKQIDDRRFEELSLELSEAPGFFDTDNLVSNESSYLHVVPRLREATRPGGAYLGVGPDQNFSYIAAIRPALGFMVDIRRNNLLQHLYFKSIFEESADRWQYLSRLLGKPLPADFEGNPAASGQEIVAAFRALSSDARFSEEILSRIWRNLRTRFPELLREADQEKIGHIARSFFGEHINLKFRSLGRASRAFYPTFGELIATTDLEGNEQSYLASEQNYQVVRGLQQRNRVIPVIGDLAGESALSRVGEFLKSQDLRLSAFYLSNVEFYLFQSNSFRYFLRNLKALPSDEDSFVIRSYFGYWRRPHPETVPRHAVTSLLQRIPSLINAYSENPFLGYRELLFRYYEPLYRGKQDFR